MAEKIYVGKARYITFRDGGEKCRIWLTPEGVESINANVDNNGGINLVMVEMRDPDRAGNTHTIYVDDWKPAGSGSRRSHAPQRGSDRDDRRRPERDDSDEPSRRAGRGGRNNGGFGNDSQQQNEHRYSAADKYPDPPPEPKDVNPAPFPESDFNDIDDDIPF